MSESNTEKGFAIGTSAIGTGVVGLLLSFPSKCPPLSDQLNGAGCENVLGFTATTLNQAQSLGLGAVAGLLGGAAADLYMRHTRPHADPA